MSAFDLIAHLNLRIQTLPLPSVCVHFSACQILLTRVRRLNHSLYLLLVIDACTVKYSAHALKTVSVYHLVII